MKHPSDAAIRAALRTWTRAKMRLDTWDIPDLQDTWDTPDSLAEWRLRCNKYAAAKYALLALGHRLLSAKPAKKARA